LITVDNLEVAPNLRHLYTHLVENKFIENITTFNADALKIYSGEVLAKIHSGDESLAQLIPPQIFEVIKAKKLFGWGQKQAAAAV
ncbi:MAG TPA: TonB-dependent receptor, partial [Verrucomicrobiae bacterium]|nr:TonB-dependent receptor [Verrucomicrobiae bacterium]